MKLDNGSCIAEDGSLCSINVYTNDGTLIDSYSGIVENFDTKTHPNGNVDITFNVNGMKYLILNAGTVIVFQKETYEKNIFKEKNKGREIL